MVWPKDRLTKFEVARLVGARALQVALGAPVLAEVTNEFNPIEIAKVEFRNKIIPMTIKRKLPDGIEMTIDMKNGIENWLADHDNEI